VSSLLLGKGNIKDKYVNMLIPGKPENVPTVWIANKGKISSEFFTT